MISGDVLDVRKSMHRQVVRFGVADNQPMPWLTDLGGVRVGREREDHLELVVPDADTAQEVLREAIRRRLTVTQFDISYPSLNDVFLSQVRGLRGDEAEAVEESVLARV
jgi:ABC-type uncharacterized transport system ATPase subunit